MIRAPKLDEIQAAERRVSQSKQNTLDSLRRVPAAFKAVLARPSTLIVVLGAAGLFGFRLARRSRAIPSSDDGLNVAARPAAAGVVAVFIARYAMQYLTSIFREAWAARKQGAVQTGANVSRSPTADYSATGAHQ